tara:strand:- start:28 stop:447 length:420 start_codon:yes stop_codon:yes gene_type:complete
MTYKIIGKYIKDLNFSIPNPKTFFLLSRDITNYKINIDIKSNRVKENIIEVLTTLNLTPTKNDIDKINTRIVFATLLELFDNKIKKNEIEKIVLIEVPNKVYSDVRNIFVNLFKNSGFNDVKINEKVDFKKLYEMRKVQ